MSQTDSSGIKIDVQVEYLPEQSDPDAPRYLFAYHITISNEGQQTMTLRRRHWLITNGRGETEDVRGAGVVGLEPTIHPGESFRYSSGCPLDTPVGTMQGEYTMETENGKLVETTIPPFRLALPGSLH